MLMLTLTTSSVTYRKSSVIAPLGTKVTCVKASSTRCLIAKLTISVIGRASLARENEAGDNWGQEVHILHVEI